MYDEKKHHLIWSNVYHEPEWDSEMESLFPDTTEPEQIKILCDLQYDELDIERMNLDIQLGMPIIVIADLGLWDGRKKGYKVIGTGNVSDCLYDDCDYITWYVDEEHELRCDASHHDGTNHYLYRVFRKGTTDDQMEELEMKIYSGMATQEDIDSVTASIGTKIEKVYGWKEK